jgi:hypothetical protein
MHVASVLSGCYKSKIGVANVAMAIYVCVQVYVPNVSAVSAVC